jgi:hypothetical protein
MQTNEFLSLAPVAIAMGILLMNSCNMFNHLIEKKDDLGFRPSIWIHLITTLLLVCAVLVLLIPPVLGWLTASRAIKISFLLAGTSVLTMIPCALCLVYCLLVRGKKLKG